LFILGETKTPSESSLQLSVKSVCIKHRRLLAFANALKTGRVAVRLCVAILSVAMLGLIIQSREKFLEAEEFHPVSFASAQERLPQQVENSDSPDSAISKKESSQERSPSDEKAGQNVEINPITGVGSVSVANYQALTGEDRWHLYFKQNFTTVGAYFGVLMGSVLDQVENQPPEWGQGISGYGQRLASRFGSGVIQGTIQASACALVGQDPRYIRSGSEHAWPRIGHALLYSVLTYNKEGKTRFAAATLGSYYSSSMIATSWLPSRYSPLGDGIRDGNRQVILAGVSNLVQEFWPEVRKIIGRK
jgi:hypothetical protein